MTTQPKNRHLNRKDAKNRKKISILIQNIFFPDR